MKHGEDQKIDFYTHQKLWSLYSDPCTYTKTCCCILYRSTRDIKCKYIKHVVKIYRSTRYIKYRYIKHVVKYRYIKHVVVYYIDRSTIYIPVACDTLKLGMLLYTI